jgi:hypothetical protein
MLMLRPIQKRVLAVSSSLPAPANTGLFTEPGFAAIPDSPAGLEQRSILLKKQLAESVRVEPERSVTAVRAWLQEETL